MHDLVIRGGTIVDGTGEPAALWAIVRVSLERGGPGEADKGEDVDLEGFSLRVWGENKNGSGRTA